MKHNLIDFRAAITAIFAAFVLLVSGCTTLDPIREAESSIAAGRYEEGLRALETLDREGKRPKDVRPALLRNRTDVIQRISQDAHKAIEADRLDDAESLYKRLLTIDANNTQATVGLHRLLVLRDRNASLAQAEELLRHGDMEEAEFKLRGILLEYPAYPKALGLMKRIVERQPKANLSSPVLGPEFRKVISLEFREASLKDIFDSIWHASGINFILDRDVRIDTKASIYVRDVTIEEAIDALLMTQQLAKKTVNNNTLLIYPKTPQKISEYQDLTVRNFFIAYADVKQVQLLLKTILKIKEVYIDEKRNLLVIRDNQEAVNMAEKLIRAHDQPEPEVMLAIDVIEIKRSKLDDIGISFSNQITLGVANPLSVDALKKLNSSGINVGFSGAGGANNFAQANLKKSDGDTNMLANPRIRVRNREKAKIHIGDRLPVVTTTSSSTSTFVGETVNYLDVGLKLEVEPQVMLDDDVVIKINLEVSSATQSTVNAKFYDVGTRNTTTVLTTHDGETQVLAGLIRDEERRSTSRLPGLGDIPLLGRLFSDEMHSKDKTEIILAITPHILSNLIRPNADLIEYTSGSDSDQRIAINTGIRQPPNTPQSRTEAPPTTPTVQPSLPTVPSPNPATSPAPLPTGGVIPMIDFEPPPGVGSPPVVR